MTCCGPIIEMTDDDDGQPVFLCRNCGKRFCASDPDSEAPLSLIARVRWWLAERIAPKQ